MKSLISIDGYQVGRQIINTKWNIKKSEKKNQVKSREKLVSLMKEKSRFSSSIKLCQCTKSRRYDEGNR